MRRFGALFDLDGVLVDSESQYTTFWAGIEEIYPTGIDNYAVAIKGTTLTVILNNYEAEEVKKDVVRRLHEFEDAMVFRVYPGAVEFLKSLRANGIPVALVTSSDNAKMSKLYRQLPGFDNYFDALITGSMVKKSKPDPEGYLTAARLIGCQPEDCFVFEDSMQGLAAGRASGATVIGLATTYPASVLEDKAKAIIPGFSDFTVEDMIALANS